LPLLNLIIEINKQILGGDNLVKKYNKKAVLSGNIIEFYEYEKDIFFGFECRNEKGRGSNMPNKSEDDKKRYREQVLNRSRRDIRRLVNSNIEINSKFLTLTFADNVSDLRVSNYEFKKFRQRLEDNLGIKLQYLAVPEFQKRGAVHYHVIIFNFPYVKNKQLQEIWGNGFVKINKIDSVDNVGAYVCKYLHKDLDDDRLKGKKCYFTSRGLRKPIEIKEKEQVMELQSNLPAEKLTYTSEFRSDELGKITYSQYNLNK